VAQVPDAVPALGVRDDSFLQEQMMKSSAAIAGVFTVVLTLLFVAAAADAPKLTFKFTTV